MSDYRGCFLWYELMTTDVDAAKGFYTDVVGWGTMSSEASAQPYSMFTAAEQPVAGFMELPQHVKAMGIPPHWMVYIGTPDIETAMVQVERLGGKNLNGPIDVPNIGRFAVMSDPQGAAFSAFQPTDVPDDPQRAPTVGHISWNELVTTDWEAAWGFYETLFGWNKLTANDLGAEFGTYQTWGVGEREMGGMFTKPPSMPIPPNWAIYIQVADLKATMERVTAKGGKVLNGPNEVPGGDLTAQCMDPQGAAFAIHQAAS